MNDDRPGDEALRSVPPSTFADDDGTADLVLHNALSAYAQGVATGGEVLEALVGSRVLVPLVAVLETEPSTTRDASPAPGGKPSAMATVTIAGPDGRRALVAFTSTATLAAWRDDARPLPVVGRKAAVAALSDGADSMFVDPAGPFPFAVAGEELRRLAFARDVAAPLCEDADIQAAVTACLANEPDVRAALLHGVDAGGLRVTVVVDPKVGAATFRALVPRLTHALAADLVLRSRLAGAMQISVVPPGQEPTDAALAFRR